MSHFVSHYFYNKYAAVGRGCRVDPVNCISRDIHRALESERHLCPPQVIVNGLWKCDHIKPFFSQQVRGFMRSVSSQDHQAVEVELMICMLHCLDFVKPVLVRHSHQFKRLSGCPENGASSCQDP